MCITAESGRLRHRRRAYSVWKRERDKECRGTKRWETLDSRWPSLDTRVSTVLLPFDQLLHREKLSTRTQKRTACYTRMTFILLSGEKKQCWINTCCVWSVCRGALLRLTVTFTLFSRDVKALIHQCQCSVEIWSQHLSYLYAPKTKHCLFLDLNDTLLEF